VLYARLLHRTNKTREALHAYEELVALMTKLRGGEPCSELGNVLVHAVVVVVWRG